MCPLAASSCAAESGGTQQKRTHTRCYGDECTEMHTTAQTPFSILSLTVPVCLSRVPVLPPASPVATPTHSLQAHLPPLFALQGDRGPCSVRDAGMRTAVKSCKVHAHFAARRTLTHARLSARMVQCDPQQFAPRPLSFVVLFQLLMLPAKPRANKGDTHIPWTHSIRRGHGQRFHCALSLSLSGAHPVTSASAHVPRARSALSATENGEARIFDSLNPWTQGPTLRPHTAPTPIDAPYWSTARGPPRFQMSRPSD